MKVTRTFENGDVRKMMEESNLISMFWGSFLNEFELSEGSEIYLRVSEDHNKVNFDVSAFSDPRNYGGNQDIARLDEPQIIADVLKVAQQRRLIGRKVYEIVPDLKLDGEYIVNIRKTHNKNCRNPNR